jgi:hypothetical protein
MAEAAPFLRSFLLQDEPAIRGRVREVLEAADDARGQGERHVRHHGVRRAAREFDLQEVTKQYFDTGMVAEAVLEAMPETTIELYRDDPAALGRGRRCERSVPGAEVEDEARRGKAGGCDDSVGDAGVAEEVLGEGGARRRTAGVMGHADPRMPPAERRESRNEGTWPAAT